MIAIAVGHVHLPGMKRMHLAVLVALMSPGCGGASGSSANPFSGTAANGTATESTGAGTDTVGEPDPSTGEEPAGSGSTSSSGTSGTSGDPTGGSGTSDETFDLGLCERLIACATAAVIPVTPLIDLYGEEGSCWAEFEPEACLIDCGSQLSSFADLYSEIEACRECDSDDDCSIWMDRPYCGGQGECCDSPGGCVQHGNCGNDSIDAGEQCDGSDLAGFDCSTLGLGGGQLVCDPITCEFDVSGCMS